jgi:hypothetical protein
MARISGLEKSDAPWHLRWFYGVMRKMFGKDFTPTKIQMRLPGLVWGGIAMEAGFGRKRLVSLRYISTWKNPRCGPGWMSFLNRCQFCRGQKSRPER